jgi:preprotein translocase subunit SecF
LASTGIVLLAGMVFGGFAIANKSLSSGANTSIEFSGGTIVDIDSSEKKLSKNQAKLIKDFLIKHKIVSTDEVSVIYQKATGTSKDGFYVQIKTKKILEVNKDNEKSIQKIINNDEKLKLLNLKIQGDTVTAQVANNLSKEAIIAILIAMAAIVAYTLIRFR